MDPSHFDRFTIAVARRGTRRSVLALLSAVGVRALVVAETHAQTCLADGKRCDPTVNPTDCCSGICRKRRRRRGKCAPCLNECCTNAHCATGKSCCGTVCRECCVDPMCQVKDPKLHCCAGTCVECCNLPGQCPLNQDCSGNVCGTPPECGTAGDACGQNADCCSNACNGTACGPSGVGEQCIGDPTCETGLVCRGFVCTTP